ncbi:MAG: PH domain-containing protein [Methanolinea sp.]|nr:PH domain-containing protein [Methanolinea sp.]
MTEAILPRGAVRDPDGTIVFRPSPRLRAYYLLLLILLVWIGILPWLIFAAFTLPGELTLMLVVPLLVIVLLARWWIPRSWASLSFRFIGNELIATRGAWRPTTREIPYSSIQRVEVVCGPLCKRLGIANLRVITGSDQKSLRIPGVEDPEGLKEIIMESVKKGGSC